MSLPPITSCQEITVTVIMARKHAKRQLGGFAVGTLAWFLCSISMGLPHWRVWFFQDPMESKPGMILVGMWRTCVYHQESNSSFNRVCYKYTYQDTFIPLDIRVAQHLLLIASSLGIAATISVIVALWKLYSGRLRKKATFNPFRLPGILNIIASSFVFLSTLYNYLSIFRKDGIAFPPSFRTPSFPDSQKVGTALVMATISCFLFLVGGIIPLSFTLPPRYRVR
ncbi:claudin-34-like [Grammomys surdaster]|uniref:claudin-34-like n=1 Tax=Grammomys surdaster TaxID=491861 RepID=UPI00109FB1B4|nr:claudin-34-like [Grammomys surdaster]